MRDNVEIVREILERWRQNDASLQSFAEDVEWDYTVFPDGRVVRGHEGMARFLRRWIGTWEEYELLVDDVIPAGEGRVAALTRERGRGKGSDAHVELEAGFLFTLRDGKVVRFKGFLDRAAVLEAAGPTKPDNVALVRRFEESWAKRNLDAALDCVHDELEFDWSDSMGPFVGTYRGRDGLTRFWTEMQEAWERFSPEMVEVFECGPDRLITLDVVRARGKGSGIDMEARGAMLWTVQNGKIVRVKMFQTKEDALQAVGLSE